MITSRTVWTCSICHEEWDAEAAANRHVSDVNAWRASPEAAAERARVLALRDVLLGVYQRPRYEETGLVLHGAVTRTVVDVVEVGAWTGGHQWYARLDKPVPDVVRWDEGGGYNLSETTDVPTSCIQARMDNQFAGMSRVPEGPGILLRGCGKDHTYLEREITEWERAECYCRGVGCYRCTPDKYDGHPGSSRPCCGKERRTLAGGCATCGAPSF
jgi:hypothetical protein